MDYQKLIGVRNNDGDTAVWDDVDDTEIPQLQSYLHDKVLEKRKANAKASITGLINFSQHLEAFLTDAGDKGGGDKAEKKRIQQAAKVCIPMQGIRLGSRRDLGFDQRCDTMMRRRRGFVKPQRCVY